jgi:hypothetical protein
MDLSIGTTSYIQLHYGSEFLTGIFVLILYPSLFELRLFSRSVAVV